LYLFHCTNKHTIYTHAANYLEIPASEAGNSWKPVFDPGQCPEMAEAYIDDKVIIAA